TSPFIRQGPHRRPQPAAATVAPATTSGLPVSEPAVGKWFPVECDAVLDDRPDTRDGHGRALADRFEVALGNREDQLEILTEEHTQFVSLVGIVGDFRDGFVDRERL